jgi:hypothetical protein
VPSHLNSEVPSFPGLFFAPHWSSVFGAPVPICQLQLDHHPVDYSSFVKSYPTVTVVQCNVLADCRFEY